MKTQRDHFQCCAFGRSATSPNKRKLLFEAYFRHHSFGKGLAKVGSLSVALW